MSKSRYLKASELGISHKELRAFVWVKKLLLQGALAKVINEKAKGIFNVNETGHSLCSFTEEGEHWCGTAACIGGWVGLKLYAADPFKPTEDELYDAKEYVRRYLTPLPEGHMGPLELLFWENIYSKIEPIDAAKAVDLYLRTGEGS